MYVEESTEYSESDCSESEIIASTLIGSLMGGESNLLTGTDFLIGANLLVGTNFWTGANFLNIAGTRELLSTVVTGAGAGVGAEVAAASR